jgi:hypothetical protein
VDNIPNILEVNYYDYEHLSYLIAESPEYLEDVVRILEQAEGDSTA